MGGRCLAFGQVPEAQLRAWLQAAWGVLRFRGVCDGLIMRAVVAGKNTTFVWWAL